MVLRPEIPRIDAYPIIAEGPEYGINSQTRAKIPIGERRGKLTLIHEVVCERKWYKDATTGENRRRYIVRCQCECGRRRDIEYHYWQSMGENSSCTFCQYEAMRNDR